MKKPKVSLDGAKIQAFFIQHVEKLLLVVVVGLAIFLVYKGFSVTGLQATQSPQGLLTESENVRKFIDDPLRWDRDIAKTREVNMPIDQMVIDFQMPTDPTAYYLANAWSRPDFPKLSPRQDPVMFPPESLKVVGIIGPLATLEDGTPDPLEIIPDEDAPKAKPKPKKSTKKADPLAATGPAGMAPPRAKPAKPAKKARGGGEGVGDPNILDEGMPAEAMAGMPGMGFGGASGSGSMAKINPESIQGFAANQGAKATHAQALVVMAVVPYQKQLEEFQNALASSLDYDPARDTPMYLLYLVERADVTDDPGADPEALKWTRLGVNAALQEARSNWVGGLGEVVDVRYLDPPQSSSSRGLTHPAPFMQRDPWELLTHPDVPLAPLAVSESEKLGPDGRPIPIRRPTGPATEILDVPLLGPGGDSSGGSGFGPTSGGASAGAGMPVMPGMGAAGMPGAGGAPGMGGSGMGGYGDPASLEPPKYKLIRFTDMTPEVDRKYRYRLKVIIHDPNHPATGFTPPSLPSLDSKVQARLKTVDPKIYYVESAWSAPSPVASLPDMNRYFAGSISATKGTNVVENKPPVPVGQPEANALTVVWDSAKVVDVPGENPVFRGSVLNFKQDTQVVHPVTHMAVPLTEYKFSTNAIVADMLGGEDIPLLDRSGTATALKAPGELLIVDAAGNLHVRDEIADVENFRVFVVPEAPEVSESSDAMGNIGGDTDAGGILGMPMPGRRGTTP